MIQREREEKASKKKEEATKTSFPLLSFIVRSREGSKVHS